MLGEIKGDIGKLQGETKSEIDNIKKKQDSADMWENVKIIVLMPVMGLLHHFFGKN